MVYAVMAYYKDHWDKALNRADVHIIGVVDAPEGMSQEEVFRAAIQQGQNHPSEFTDPTPINVSAVWAVPVPAYFTRIENGVIDVTRILGEMGVEVSKNDGQEG